jgi:hypothetical protein
VKLAQSVARPTTAPRQKEENMFEDLKVRIALVLLSISC